MTRHQHHWRTVPLPEPPLATIYQVRQVCQVDDCEATRRLECRVGHGGRVTTRVIEEE